MKTTLQLLYDGQLLPCELLHRSLPERAELKKQHLARYEAFVSTLSERQKEEFRVLWDELYDDFPLEGCEAFVGGFRLGARIMLEALEPFEREELD